MKLCSAIVLGYIVKCIVSWDVYCDMTLVSTYLPVSQSYVKKINLGFSTREVKKCATVEHSCLLE